MLRAGVGVLPPRPAGPALASVYNSEAVIPPQCYTRTEGRFNPCCVCHQNHLPNRENQQNDAALQLAYSFSEAGMTNRWTNLFEDRSERVAAISDREIDAWTAADNFTPPAGRLREAGFRGHIPDLSGLADGPHPPLPARHRVPSRRALRGCRCRRPHLPRAPHEGGPLPVQAARHPQALPRRALRRGVPGEGRGDRDGDLRFNLHEETMFCMGCHNTVGTTIDKTFAFPRKVDGRTAGATSISAACPTREASARATARP